MSDLVDQQCKFLQDVALLISKAHILGYTVTGGELYRTEEQEQWYVQQGLSKTLDSNHCRRLAIDLNFFKDGQIIEPGNDIVSFWKSLDPLNRWGGDFTNIKDTDHFERNVP